MRGLVAVVSVGICSAVIWLVNSAGRIELHTNQIPVQINQHSQELSSSADRVNAWLRRRWQAEQLALPQPASDLTILRRLSLALHGTIPSLEEIRAFESDDQPQRMERWVDKLLRDNRYANYFSERLARSLVGVEGGPFIVFRRDQLTDWLGRHLQADTPWPDLSRQMIAAEGLWTDRPQTNFITVARIEDEGLDVNKLAGRTVRTFLGQRIDCAQCHDHPFDERWSQSDFEGLAAWFASARLTLGGVTDSPPADSEPLVYRIPEPGQPEEEGRIVEPVVPFHEEWLPDEGSPRERLAAWVTDPGNRRFERAIANRIWGLMFGKPWHDPVDDLPHPSDEHADGSAIDADLLDVLGQEFRKNGGTIGNLIRIIALSDAFRASSASNSDSPAAYDHEVEQWAVFPLIRLRPEQVIGSLFQANSVSTVDQNSHVFIRLIRFANENDFIKEYGDLGDDELLQQVGTIPQSLLRMNGRFTREFTKADGFSSAAQVIRFSKDDQAIIENCFLTCLTRRPTEEEAAYFVEKSGLNLAELPESGSRDSNDKDNRQDEPADRESIDRQDESQRTQQRHETIGDLFWILFNSPEFSWNH
ncbi:MAG: DUF1549 domain-containing protein [Planctomycetaceae bacterium]